MTQGNGRPQVLLLGNGVNRAFGGGSWGRLIRDISCNGSLPEDCVLHLPMPLRAILVTGDTVGAQLRQAGDILYGKLGDPGHVDMLRRLLEMDFDHILTTNFSYELEQAAQPDLQLSDQTLRHMMRHTDARRQAEAKYLFYTYGDLAWQGHRTKVWHIHGEGRKPDSMILGHYYYANLLEKISTYVKSEGARWRREQERGETPRIKSWADAFLFGDVYVLGFGFDVSEFDLWWLLNRKKREQAETGKTWFFAPEELSEESGINEKEELLKVLGVEVRHCGMGRAHGDPLERSLGFRAFYERAMDEIEALMRERRV
ncbi:MAG: SIR2 family protein [Oscillospiraceae bacterium]|nr:SIR2 family protein [Oscillospiraceae bacterium]